MRILIAYDGSECANTSIDGLQRAGLPARDVEALVVSVGEVWLPPPSPDELPNDVPVHAPGLKQARERAARIIEVAQRLAESGSERVQRLFAHWKVDHDARNGSPPFEILNCAREWQPELIVVGWHGHTAVGRFVLGSVSQKVLTEASCSVRIGRATAGSGTSGERIIVGVDGSPGALAAVEAVARRQWTQGSELRIVVADDVMRGNPIWLLVPPIKEFVEEVRTEERSQAEHVAIEAVKELRAQLEDKSITLSSVVDSGDPKQILVRHAEEFGADCIFTGATGFSNRFERFVLGSVSAAVAARAHCSVEVVRKQQ